LRVYSNRQRKTT